MPSRQLGGSGERDRDSDGQGHDAESSTCFPTFGSWSLYGDNAPFRDSLMQKHVAIAPESCTFLLTLARVHCSPVRTADVGLNLALSCQ